MNRGAKDFRRWKACERKRKYSETDARQAAAQMKQHCYHCRYCGQWHLTNSVNRLAAQLHKPKLILRYER